MPHGKSKKSTTNPKKKGNKGVDENVASSSHRRRCGAPSLATPSTRSPLFTNSPLLDSLLCPNMESLGPASFLENAKHLLYPRYKESTKRFKERVFSMVPSDLIQSDKVSELTAVANYIATHDLEVQPELLSDLKNAIRGRKHVAMVQYRGGDARHEYCIRVLEYCWSVLSPRRKKPKVSLALQEDLEEDESGMDAFSNRFAELSASGVESDDDDDQESDLPVGSLPCPQESTQTSFTIFELINGTDHMNINFFLKTLDDLMSRTADKFAQLKTVSASVREHKYPPGILIQHLIEASVVANFAIQQIVSLEKVFIQDNPHLNTVYRVLAALVLTEQIQHLTSIVESKSPVASQFSKDHAIAFVGDAVESVFGHVASPRGGKFDSLVSEFRERWELPDDDKFGDNEWRIQEVFDNTTFLANIEARLIRDVDDDLISRGIVNPMWLPHEYIGQNRSIIHTIRLLQVMATLVSLVGETHVHLLKDAFGSMWDDCKTPPSSIQFDMDRLLMGDILPSLLNLCFVGGRRPADFPFQDTIFAAFGQLKALMKNPDSAVSWSLAFAVHSILTAIFEFQKEGDDNLRIIGVTARQTIEKFFQQIKWVQEYQLSEIASRPPPWDINIKGILDLQKLLHINIARTDEQVFLSLWNPLSAGAYLSYIAYCGNLSAGSTMVDMMGQLRMSLHLFNALKQVQAIQPGQVEVLDLLMETRGDSKRTWNGPLPRQGQFQNRWQSITFTRNSEHDPDECPSATHAPFTLEDFSKSFDPVCMHNFHGMYSKRKKCKQTTDARYPLGKYDHKLNHILTAMKIDQHLLSMNTTCLALFLNQFCVDLFVELGIMAEVERLSLVKQLKSRSPKSGVTSSTSILGTWHSSRDAMKYDAMQFLFAIRVLRPLDAGDALMTSRCAEFTKRYFSSLPTEKMTWFNSTSCHEMEVCLQEL